MSDKTVINNWNGGGTLQTWTDGEWQILYAKDSAGNCVTLSLTSQDAIRLAYAVSPTPSEIFERMRAANEAVYEMSYPEARADELRHIADEIDCGGSCEECSQQKLDRGEFCGFVAADNMRKLATALDLKAALSKPAPVAANASAEARLREKQSLVERIIIRRLHQEKLDGYTIETAREIIEALSSHPHASDCFASVTVPASGIAKLMDAVENPPQPNEALKKLMRGHAIDCDKQGEPGLNWKLSDECKRQLAEIDDNIRNAALNAGNIVAGKRP